MKQELSRKTGNRIPMKQALSLYEINENILSLMAEIESAEANEDLDLITELEGKLAELYPALDEKRSSYVKVIRDAEAHSTALRKESRRFAERARNMDNLAARLKRALHDDLVENGEARAEAGKFRLSIAKSPPSVRLSVLAEGLPEQYQLVRFAEHRHD